MNPATRTAMRRALQCRSPALLPQLQRGPAPTDMPDVPDSEVDHAAPA